MWWRVAVETSFFYSGVSVSLFVCSECLICVLAVFAALRLSGRPGEMVVKVHCGTVLDEFAAVLKMRPPKQSHNALWNHLDPLSRANSKWRTLLVEERIMEERGKDPVCLSLGTDVNSPKLFLDQLYARINRKLVSGEGRKRLFSVVRREFNSRHYNILHYLLWQSRTWN